LKNLSGIWFVSSFAVARWDRVFEANAGTGNEFRRSVATGSNLLSAVFSCRLRCGVTCRLHPWSSLGLQCSSTRGANVAQQVFSWGRFVTCPMTGMRLRREVQPRSGVDGESSCC
jgi:hypothetical protein